jgi:hypothetical protein
MSNSVDPWTTMWTTGTNVTPSPVYTINTIGTGNVANGSSWNYTTVADPNLKGASLKVHGDAEFDGDLKVQGKSLMELLDNIEKRLAILHPNKKLEEKWERLKSLGDMYRELEAEIIEKEEIWSILKK